MEHPPYVNIPPIAKTRSTSHLAPTPEHHRSVSFEEMTTASTSTDSVPGVRIRSESSQVSCDSPTPAPRNCPTYVAAYEYVAQKEDELDLPLGAIVRLVTAETQEDGWYKGELNGKIGLFPSNYGRLLEDHLVEFTTDEIKLEDETKLLEEFRIGHGATATVFKVELATEKLRAKEQNGEKTEYKEPYMNAALKRFNKHTFNTRGEHMTEQQQLEQLKREANLVNGLNHQNIVGFLGICLDNPYFGLLLELCEGSSLRTVCRNIGAESAIPMKVLVDWANQIADGMKYLTKEGYVHRDLKADNVLVKEEVCFCLDKETMNFQWCSKCGRTPVNKLHLKITDFGVSRKMTADANRFSTAGTYAWLAPEAFRDGSWSEASDVWSYGVVLWELLSREDPYQGQIPATIAFQIVMRGQSLAINDNCPPKWKTIMQSCWELDPANRPSFAQIVDQFTGYAEELKNAPEVEEDTVLQRAPSKIANTDLYSHLTHVTLQKAFNEIYTPSQWVNRKDRTSIAPETKARKAHNYKVRKTEISMPIGKVSHVLSVQKDKTNEHKFNMKWNDENFDGGTLPRLSGRQSALSLSSPDLYQIHDILNGSQTIGPSSGNRISRKNAIRVKKPHNYDPHTISPNSDDTNMFAKITNANEASVHPKEPKKGGTLSRAWAKLPWKNQKRDSKEDHDDKAGSISSRSSSTTSSNRIIAGQATRGACAYPFLEAGARSRAQSAVDSSADDANGTRVFKVSPNDKRPVKQTNLTERFTKDSDKDSVMRPGNLPNYHRKSALDQPIPASPQSPDSINSFVPMHVSSRRTTANSSSDGGATYEPLVMNSNSHSQGTGHGFRNPIIHPSLSDFIPITGDEQTHYEMGPGSYFDRNGGNQNIYGHISTPTYGGIGHGNGKQSTHYYPVGGGCDSYIPIAPRDMRPVKPTVGEVNNSPYSDKFQFLSRNVQNPQYIQCKQNIKPTRAAPALPIKIQSETNLNRGTIYGTAYSPMPVKPNGIGNGMSSLSLNEAPNIPAPPPPRVSMSPPTRLAPVLPIHEGSISPDSRKIMDQEILKQPVVEGTEIF